MLFLLSLVLIILRDIIKFISCFIFILNLLFARVYHSHWNYNITIIIIILLE